MSIKRHRYVLVAFFVFTQLQGIPMTIKLSKGLRSNSANADPLDVRQVKQALNQLGYYMPYSKTGMTDIPDNQMFAALKSFQFNQGLQPTGQIAPNDATVQRMNESTSQNKDERYIWLTMGDSSVRDSHSALDGETRSWNKSPVPGEEYNCRCSAVPIEKVLGLTQVITTEAKDAQRRWGNLEFLWHFYIGGGAAKTLSEIGWLGGVIERSKSVMFDRVLAQVAASAMEVQSGAFSGSWDKSYEFESLLYSFGGVTIRGTFGGSATKIGKFIYVDVKARYEFWDEFTDPVSVREFVLGTSAVSALPPSLLGAYVLTVTDIRGAAFEVSGEWETSITGYILVKE